LNCPHCKNQNLDDAVFCDECGTPLESACSSCGEANRRAAKFCKKCGQSLSRPAIRTQSTEASTSARQPPIPKHLAEKILAERHTLEGERKQVTILFADIKDSTRLVEGRDPEEAQKVLDPILKVMMDAVHRYEGTVNHILGDGIMALFGAPLAHEDHAVRACYAALAMQQQLRHYANEIGPSDELPQIRIGLNSGEVVVRTIDNDLNFDYLAVGDSIHLAARMQELAAPGAILMTARTLREVEGFVQVNSLGLLQAKGFAQLIESFELIGVTAVRKRLHAAVARGLSDFVGRSTEIEVFNRVLQQASSGHGQILALCGEPGMGKSRLVYEFTHSHLPPQWTVFEATSASYGKATPYYPLIDLLRRYVQVEEGENRESIRLKAQTRLLGLDERLKDAVPPLLALLDALPDDNMQDDIDALNSRKERELSEAIKKFEDLEPQQRRHMTFEALKRVLVRESLKQPVLLLMEDLHWIDNETQAFLDHLVESLPMTRLLLLVNHRPGYSHTWSDKSYYTQIRVDPLSDQGSEELVRSLFGDNEDLMALRELLIKRTEGNPFFVEESVRSLVESGFLVGSKGQYRPGRRIDSIRIPSTVQTVLADRIDRLPTPEKHLLQTASAIGVIVPMALLRAVAGLPEDELHRHLATLRSSEFLFESNLFPDLEYTFKHALTNEVVYGAMLHDHKSLLHAGILAVLEDTSADNLGENIETLAHHALRAELWEKAVTYSRGTGAKAMSHSGFVEAISWYKQAFRALGHLPESRNKLEEEIDLHLEARNALFLLGDLPQVAEHLHQAESLAERLGDQHRLARVLNFLNSYYGLIGDPERAIQFGRRALALPAAHNNTALNAVANYYLGAAYNKLGEYTAGIDVLQHGIRNVDGELRFERFGTALVLSVICRSHLVQCLAALGRFAEGVRYGEEGVAIAEEVAQPASVIHMKCSLASLFIFKGDFALAVPFLENSLALCSSAKVPVYVPFVSARLGCAYMNSGRLSEAMPFLHAGVQNSAAAGRVAFLSLNTLWLSEGYLASGHLENASAAADEAFKLARKHKERGHEAWTLKLLGDITLLQNLRDANKAEAYYRQALALSEELGMRPLQAHCLAGIGKAHAERKLLPQAHAEFASALELYRSMEMSFWAAQVQSILAGLHYEHQLSI
jgi:class 3 adenylate cyclase/tetratricopeptide (TPR) repeat protein